MKRITPSANRGRVEKTATKIAKTSPFIKFSVHESLITLRGLQAQVLIMLLDAQEVGLPCAGSYRAMVANLPQVIAAIRRKKILVETIRDSDRRGRYVLRSNISAIDVRSF
jgi:hypothetical protein